jgi:hypothetical protein
MRLQAKEIKESPEEVTSRQSESALKVRQKHHTFTRFGDRCKFLPRFAAYDLRGYTPGA